ncbi:uncharacterized protein LOC120133639 [Hibiscus syriacus]|uniref:uncharacterized protein LOC120133639 n=1 Tax=Hibiscus syriacus TaxID=106335 RepID=UPI0019243DC0|nr:uncharacterized protein LOC120133639 [Hibiscus syriacus]
MDMLKAIKADLARLREKDIGIGERLVSVESSLKELKRLISECRAKANLVGDLVNFVIQAAIENDLNIDEETMVLIEETTRALTEALNQVQSSSSCPAAAENGGGHDEKFK